MINEYYETGNFYSVIPNITKDYNNTAPKFLNLDSNDKIQVFILRQIGA